MIALSGVQDFWKSAAYNTLVFAFAQDGNRYTEVEILEIEWFRNTSVFFLLPQPLSTSMIFLAERPFSNFPSHFSITGNRIIFFLTREHQPLRLHGENFLFITALM